MTEDEKRDLNWRVAVALGGRVIGEFWHRRRDGVALGAVYLPDFCGDSKDADLVKAYMKEQGWHYKSGVISSGAFAQVDTREPVYLLREALGQETESIALCLVFLVIVELLGKLQVTK